MCRRLGTEMSNKGSHHYYFLIHPSLHSSPHPSQTGSALPHPPIPRPTYTTWQHHPNEPQAETSAVHNHMLAFTSLMSPIVWTSEAPRRPGFPSLAPLHLPELCTANRCLHVCFPGNWGKRGCKILKVWQMVGTKSECKITVFSLTL